MFNYETQFVDFEYGRPDIYININDNYVIVIECKVESYQEETQLKRYSDFLLAKHTHKEKHLVFLTKFFETTPKFPNEITFNHLRWYEIFDLLTDKSNQITNEFAKYLIDEKMNSTINFNLSELNAIKEYQETFSKMNDFLVRAKEILKSFAKTKKIQSDKLIEYGSYGASCEFCGGELWLGFYQYEADNEMQICISVEIKSDNPKFKQIDKALKLLEWDHYDNSENMRTWHKHENFSSFFINEKFEANRALEFLRAELLELKKWF
jgi:hypothetical protein